ncbi:MAG: glucose-6-phosphate isomerase family protein [Candidatus Altiarchaeota archaeon]|nr:glucose-6-phosphate isomerase family protein [Candidatus Altiarchaeota archaeon]
MKKLRFGGSLIEPQVRMLSEIKEVVYDLEWLGNSSDTELYYMYRDLALNGQDRGLMKGMDLRYDITVIPPGMLGREYVKTMGHYHPPIPGTKLSYTEIYEVLEGRAHYLLQRLEDEGITDVILIEAVEGDKVIIPPNYGHITINPSGKVLKMANFVSSKFSSVYEPIKERHGGAYFELVDGFRRNEYYAHVPELRRVKARDLSEFGFTRSDEMYYTLRSDPAKLGFLNKPQDQQWIFNLY